MQRIALYTVSILLGVLSSTGEVSSFATLKGTSVPTPTPVLSTRSVNGKLLTDCLSILRGGKGSSKQQTLQLAAEASSDFSETSISVVSSEAYYLVWSPKFIPKLALATFLLAATRRLGWDYRVFGFFAGSSLVPSGLFSNLVLPLLSSSCCAIQLAVNAISVVMGAGAGCIGFNTVLGPLRPYLLAVMVAYHNAFHQSSPSATMLRCVIALMPEFVFGWNALVRSSWRRGTSKANATNNDNVIKATLVVEVPTMGCVACVNKIESSLRKSAPDKIVTASSWLNPKKEDGGKKGGRAKIEVKVSSRDELDDLAQSLVGAIEDAGFQGTSVEKMEIQTNVQY